MADDAWRVIGLAALGDEQTAQLVISGGEVALDGAQLVADAHERRKNFLNEAEVDRLLEGAKKGRHGAMGSPR